MGRGDREGAGLSGSGSKFPRHREWLLRKELPLGAVQREQKPTSRIRATMARTGTAENQDKAPTFGVPTFRSFILSLSWLGISAPPKKRVAGINRVPDASDYRSKLD